MRSDLAGTLNALADPTRLAVIRLLGKKPRRSSDVAAALEVPRPAMSRHLRILRKAGIVEEASLEEDARARMYQLRAQPFSDLRVWLDEVEAFWGEQLQALKAHAERRRR